MARAAHKMALESSRIKAEVTEISEFPRLAQRYGVRAVPMTVINDRLVVMGAVDESKLLEQVLKAAVPEGLPTGTPGTLAPSAEGSGPTTPTGAPQQPATGRPEDSGLVLP